MWLEAIINKYGSTSYVGMGQVQNGHLHLKVWEELCGIRLLEMPHEFCYPTQKLRKTNSKISIL